MATGIEFTSNPGKSFTAWVLKSPTNYATLATGGSITEVTAGRYQFVTNQTGIVWVEVTAGATKALGFADLDNPETNGYSEIVDQPITAKVLKTELDKVIKSGQAITHVRAGKTNVIETVTRN